MKTGLLGGSFNPIHLGHLAIAEAVYSQLNLSDIWFIPTAFHPFKQKSQLLPFEKRLKLILKAIEPYPDFKISLLDSDQDAKNYTYDLIRKIKSENPAIEPFFIIGSDILNELTKWYKYEWLLENITFAVIKRPDQKIDHKLSEEQLKKLKFVDMTPVPVSSTEIRYRIKKDQPITGLVPDSILEDILSYYKQLNTVI